MQRRSCVVDRHTTTQAGGTMQGDGADMLLIKVLVNFEQIGFVIEVCAQCLTQRGQLVTGNDYNRSMDFGDCADWNELMFCKRCIGQRDNSC